MTEFVIRSGNAFACTRRANSSVVVSMLRTAVSRHTVTSSKSKALKSDESAQSEPSASTGFMPITLVLQGRRFSTTKEILTKERGTFFSNLLSGNFAESAESADGAGSGQPAVLVIERSPKHFGIILDHMNGEHVLSRIFSLQAHEFLELRVEVEFFCLESLLKKISGWTPCNVRRSFNTENNRITLTGTLKEVDKLALLRSERALSAGVHTWRVRMDRLSKRTNGQIWSYSVILGVGSKSNLMYFVEKEKDAQNKDTVHVLDLIYGRCSEGEIYSMGKRTSSPNHWQAPYIVTVTLDCEEGKLQIDDTTIDVPDHDDLLPIFFVGSFCQITIIDLGYVFPIKKKKHKGTKCLVS